MNIMKITEPLNELDNVLTAFTSTINKLRDLSQRAQVKSETLIQKRAEITEKIADAEAASSKAELIANRLESLILEGPETV